MYLFSFVLQMTRRPAGTFAEAERRARLTGSHSVRFIIFPCFACFPHRRGYAKRLNGFTLPSFGKLSAIPSLRRFYWGKFSSLRMLSVPTRSASCSLIQEKKPSEDPLKAAPGTHLSSLLHTRDENCLRWLQSAQMEEVPGGILGFISSVTLHLLS